MPLLVGIQLQKVAKKKRSPDQRIAAYRIISAVYERCTTLPPNTTTMVKSDRDPV